MLSNPPAPSRPCSFSELGVSAELQTVLAQRGITAAFPIQVATLPDALAGRDVLGRGRTGSGKTLAFAIPTITALDRSRLRRSAGRPRALVLVPTRELAEQVADTFAPLAAGSGSGSPRSMAVSARAGRSPHFAAGSMSSLPVPGALRISSARVT